MAIILWTVDLLSDKMGKMFEINCETLSLGSALWLRLRMSCDGDEAEIFAGHPPAATNTAN